MHAAGLSETAMVVEFMTTLSTVYPSEDGRIKVLTEDDKCPGVFESVKNTVSSWFNW